MEEDKIDRHFNILAINAVRYALGRKSYVTDEVARIIIEDFDKLTIHTARLIYIDIQKAIKENNYGMEMDKEIWLNLAKHIENALGRLLIMNID